MAVNVVVRGKWKPVELEPSLFLKKDMNHLICIEELTDYSVLDRNSAEKNCEEDCEMQRLTTDAVKRKKFKRSQSVDKIQQSADEETAEKVQVAADTRTGKKRRWDVKRLKLSETSRDIRSQSHRRASSVDASERSSDKLPDISAWSDMFVPDSVLHSLQQLQFTAPTPVQALCLPPAIRDRLDIVAAAETGSGKTLAFVIPLIHHILLDKETDMTESAHDDAASTPLYALILTPTRELAMQTRDHIEAVTKYTDITCCVVVGGMSVEKQTRLLRRCPDIVIATPGRLWQLIQQGDEHLAKVTQVRYVVVDEADRMIEKGHFHELSELFQLINTNECIDVVRRRQTFVFSATLMFVPTKPQRLEFAKKKKKKNFHQITTKEKLESLMCAVGICEKAKVIDLTQRHGTTSTLTEARLMSTLHDKDLYLYYFVRQFAGRTLVFTNSKDCVRRLNSVFSLLHCCPLVLHADMQQRQRLKNLDRFKSSANGLLLATDVASRGLDIPGVQHVIHYQVPRTTENYVHRSGRTARALNEGLSVMFVSPDDLPNYRKIIKALNRDEDLATFPVDVHCLSKLRPCVDLARNIDKAEHRTKKQNADRRWLQKTAQEMDIELDSDDVSDNDDDTFHAAAQQKQLQTQKRRLDFLLKQPIRQSDYCGKYPTQSSRPTEPFVLRSTEAGAAVKQVQSQQKHKKRRRKHKANVDLNRSNSM